MTDVRMLIVAVTAAVASGLSIAEARAADRHSPWDSPETERLRRNSATLIDRYMDSLRICERNLDSLRMIYPQREPLSELGRMRLFAPPTFYYSVAADLLTLGDDGDDERQAINNTLLYVYLLHPELIKGSEHDIDYRAEVDETLKAPIRHDIELTERADDDIPDEMIAAPEEVVAAKPQLWNCSGDYYLQFLQNYISGNWYKGGESNYSMVASATMQANYNNLKGFKFDNKVELKLGFQTSKSDSLHSFITSEDLIRYTGKVGLQATKKWYYALQLIAYTQFMRGYKSNDDYVYSDFFAPFNANLSLGMDYTVEWLNKKLTGTIQLAPIAYNFKYVGRSELAETNGLDEGEHSLHEIGSGITVDLTWQIAENAKWATRLYTYTTYSRMEMEWENTFTFQLSKFFSSNIFVYPRFDDSTTRDEHHGYWQFKEYLSFGLTYSF